MTPLNTQAKTWLATGWLVDRGESSWPGGRHGFARSVSETDEAVRWRSRHWRVLEEAEQGFIPL
jgi:hypothetical protein